MLLAIKTPLGLKLTASSLAPFYTKKSQYSRQNRHIVHTCLKMSWLLYYYSIFILSFTYFILHGSRYISNMCVFIHVGTFMNRVKNLITWWNTILVFGFIIYEIQPTYKATVARKTTLPFSRHTKPKQRYFCTSHVCLVLFLSVL